MFVLIEQSTQFSISSEVYSELPSSTSSSSFSPLPTTTTTSSQSNQTGCNFKTIGQCFRLRPNELGTCAIEHAMNNMNCLIASNETWHFNDFITVKKNDEWQPPSSPSPHTEIESRQEQTSIQMALSKFNDLVSSRSIQFSLPRIFDLLPEGRVKSGFDYAGLSGFAGKKKSEDQIFFFIFNFFFKCFSLFFFALSESFNQWHVFCFAKTISHFCLLSGRKKKKHGMMGMGIILALAQLFMSKLAFLAGAALLLSKVSLLFSIVVWRFFFVQLHFDFRFLYHKFEVGLLPYWFLYFFILQ